MRNQGANFELYRKYIAQMSQAYRDREDIQNFVELLLTLSSIFVFTVFAIRPTLKTIGGLSQEISSKKETIATMDTKIDNIQKAQTTFAAETSRLSTLVQAVPAEPDPSGILRQFELIAKQNGATIESMSVDPTPLKGATLAQTGEQSVPYTLTLSGPFTTLLQTLSVVESMRRGSIFTFSTMSLIDVNGAPQIRLIITGGVPYYILREGQ